MTRNGAKLLVNCTEDQRVRALTQAVAAVEAAHLNLRDFVLANFDVRRITEQIAQRLDQGLHEDETERRLATEAIRMASARLVWEAQRQEPALLELVKVLVAETRDLSLQVRQLTDSTESVRDSAMQARVRIDARRLEDPTHTETYVGGYPSEFLAQMTRDWSHWVGRAIRLVTPMRVQNESCRRAIDVLEAIPLSGPWPTVWRRLQMDESTRSIEVLLSEARVPHRPAHRHVGPLTWLRDQTVSPRFCLAMPVLGEWGSGKSRLLDEVAIAALQANWMVFAVDALEPGTLEQAVLASAASGLRAPVATVETLRAFLRQRAGACFLIDDWHVAVARDPRRQDELIQLMGSWSDLPLRWLVTAEESSLPSLLSGRHRDMWSTYGWTFEAEPPWREVGRGQRTISGWYDLAGANERKHGSSPVAWCAAAAA